MARRLLLGLVIMARTKKQQQAHEQKLLDAVSHAASCLKEEGDPLRGLGPCAQYAAAFDRYGKALKDLVSGTCVLHVADWDWDGYEGTFDFRWDFSTPVAQPDAKYEHQTCFLAMSCAAHLDPEKPLLEELARLRAEAKHYEEFRNATVRWASAARKASLEATATEEPAS